MNTVLTLASLLLHVAGLIFLFAAALGLLRFKDALQRMHASTKAGTIGAGLVLLGAVITMDNLEGVIIGLLTVLFLLLTVPVAGHLLGRAAYLSGADLLGLEGKDALSGVLPRYPQPLEQRDQGATTESAPRLIVSMPPIAEIRFVIIPPYEKRVAERALTLSIRNGVPIEAKVILDPGVIEVSAAPGSDWERAKARLADAVDAVQTLFAEADARFFLSHAEGDAETLIPDRERADLLLVLPPGGWGQLGAGRGTRLPAATSSGLLRLPDLHAGPVLFAGDIEVPAVGAGIAVVDDRSDTIVAGLLWALTSRLWAVPVIKVLGNPSLERIGEIEHALGLAGLDATVERVERNASAATILPPDVAAECDAVIATSLPKRMDSNGDDSTWRDNIAPGWQGEVLVFPRPSH